MFICLFLQCYFLFYSLLLTFLLIMQAVDSMDGFDDDPFVIKIALEASFTFDYVLRLVFCPSKSVEIVMLHLK
jgi:hypothetical protein